MRTIISSLILCVFAATSAAADTLSVEQAVAIALRNNYRIQIAQNNAGIADNNRGLGLAEFLPRVDLSGTAQSSTSRQETNSPFSFGDSDTDLLSAGATLNWTIFDGFSMFADNARLHDLARLGEYQARDIIERTVVAVEQAYFNLIQQELLLQVAEATREISATRLEKERVRKELGGVSSTDFLNAQVAYNNDQANFLQQELNIITARQDLNILLGRNPSAPISVDREIIVDSLDTDLKQLIDQALRENALLRVAQENRNAARNAVTAARSGFLPRLSLNAGYDYADRTVNTLGAEAREIDTKSRDARIGLNLSFNLFNGGRDRITWSNAILNSRNQELALRETEQLLRAEIQDAYATYQQRIKLVALEQENVVAATQYLQLEQDRYRIGAGNSIEFRDAQNQLARAQATLIGARFQARMAQLELERLTGKLIVAP